jgi:hypothetical protein
LILSLYKKQGIMGYHRIIGIDEDVLEQGRKALIKAFSRKKPIQRRELHAALKKSGIPALRSNMARSHIMRRVARDGLMCFGPHEGKQATFVLLDDWVASKKQPTREEAIHMLASRYFASHGPATVKDFAWWSGLGISEARNGTAEVAHQLRKETFGNETYFMPKKIHKLQVDNQAAHLLPAFDEYLIAYKNRSAVLDPKYTHKVIAGSTLLFLPVILFDGRVIGTWKRRKSGKNAEIVLKPFTKLDNMQRESISIAAERYGKFIDSPIILK